MDDNSEKLRAKAKEELRQGKIIDTSLYETDMKLLVEELSIYQIELEHQNQELMLSQEQLQQSNDRYLDLFDNAPIGYLIVDSSGIIKDINQTACKLLECSKTEFVNTKISKLIHPDFQDIYYLYFRTLIHQKHQQPCDIKLRKSNNTTFYGRIQGVCLSHKIDIEAEFQLAISDITIQKEMEIKLLAAKEQTEQSEERFQMLFNKAPLGYQSLDIDGHFIEVNQQWLDTLGYERDEVIGKWFGDFLTPIYQEGFRKRFPIFKAQGHIHSEFEMVHKNGSILFIAFDGRIGNDTDGNFIQTHCILQDITESKRVKEALLEAEWKFKALFELGPIGVAYHRMIYDDAGKPIDYYFIDANDSYNELTGVSPKGMTVREAFPGIENDPFDWIGLFGKVAKTGETIRFEQYLESNGRWYDCVGYQYKPDHFVAAFSEITKRKHAEIALKGSEMRFKVLFEDAPDAMFLADIETRKIVDTNAAACRLFKKEKAELIGLYQHELHPEKITSKSKEDFDIHSIQSANAEIIIPIENVIITSEGNEIPVEIMGQFIKIGEKELMLGTFRDISERKKTSEILKRSEERYSSLLHHLETGIVVHAADTSIIMSNPRASELLGLSSDQMKGKVAIDPAWCFLNPDNSTTALETYPVNRVLGSKQSIRNQILGIRQCSNSEIVWVIVNGFPVFNIDNEIIEIVISFNDITSQRIAEQNLRESQAILQAAMDNSMAGIAIADAPNGQLRYVNEAGLFMRGEEKEKIVKDIDINEYVNTWQLLDLDGRELRMDEVPLARAIMFGEKNSREFIIRNKNNVDAIVLGKASPIRNEKEEVIAAVVVFQDITERKVYEQNLEERNNFIEKLVDLNPGMIYIYDLVNQRNEYSNEGIGIMLGYSVKEIQDMGDAVIPTLMHPDDLINYIHKILPSYSQLKDGEQLVHQYRMKNKAGEWHWVESIEVIYLRCEDQSPMQIFGMGLDITDRKKAEKALQESEEKLSMLFESMNEMVVMHELVLDDLSNAIDYRILDCNNTFTIITGIEREDAVGKLATELYQIAEAPYLSEYARVVFTGKSYEFDSYFEPMDKHFIISAVSLGENMFATIATDISDIQNAQKELKEKNQELENYIYVASHDLRSPLVNIQGFSQRLEKQTEKIHSIITDGDLDETKKQEISKISHEDVPKSLNFILNNVAKMDTLISGLLQLSRTGRIVLSVNKVDMNKLLNDVSKSFNFQLTECNAKLNIEHLADCYGEVNQLNQVFSNIISNAIKYRNTNRKLEIEISSNVDQKRVSYSIKDNGIGINERQLEKIWDIFYRVDASSPEAGDGLGLSLARRIVEKHKGKIWAESEVNVGSIFHIELQRNLFES